MKNWTTPLTSSFVAVMLVGLPVGAAGQGRHAPEGAPSSGTAEARGGGDSGGSSPSSSSGSGGMSSMPRVSAPATASENNRSARSAAGRERGDRPQVGTAAQRSRVRQPETSYQYSSRPYPSWWYSAYGPGLGYAGYDLWSWGRRPDLWWNPGLGYGPFGYDPYGLSYGGFGGYGGGYGGYGGGFGGGSSARSDREFGRPTGSIRLRVSPRDAKVYVDGALVGTVDDFDGFSDHLDLDPGRHQIELRAEGYRPFIADVTVSDGKTVTTRANMKKR